MEAHQIDCWGESRAGRRIRVEQLRMSLRQLSVRNTDAFPLISRGGFPSGLTILQILRVRGLALPPASSLSDTRVAERLHALIEELAEYDVYLRHTDHLTDRQLYRKLTEGLLNRQDPRFGDTGWILDFLEPRDEVRTRIYLRHYASEPERQDWLSRHPDSGLPPFDPAQDRRDSRLPRKGDPLETA